MCIRDSLNAGYLETTVLDIVENNGIKILVLDTSAACHMPDVLEMPYRPPLKDSGKAGEKAYTYRLSSCTCLAGDVIGDYSFDKEIKVGNRLTFCDMAIYSMVKNLSLIHISIVPCLLMVPILSGIAYAIPKYQFKKMSQESVVERIRKE